jgi:hypothetical protein
MEITITFESSVPREAVVLHAWEPLGQTWNLRAKPEHGRCTFRLEGRVADQRTVRFKYLFPYEHRWEPDDYVRRIPTRRTSSFWTFDFSPRVMIRDPYRGTAPEEISFRLSTRAEFAGGSLYLWKPGAETRLTVRERERDPDQGISSFIVPVQPWMKSGFHFKCVDASGRFEPEGSNRVWRPADGAMVHLKAGQVSLRQAALQRMPITVGLIYPATLDRPPELVLRDNSESYSETLRSQGAVAPLALDARFRCALYTAAIYPEAGYTITVADDRAEPAPYHRPVRIAADDAEAARRMTALLGYDAWLAKPLALGRAHLVFHRAERTPRIETLAFQLAIGRTLAFAKIAATPDREGSWQAETEVFIGIPMRARPVARPEVDQRSEGPIASWRSFMLADAGVTELHTLDGRLGFVRGPIEMATAKASTSGGKR